MPDYPRELLLGLPRLDNNYLARAWLDRIMAKLRKEKPELKISPDNPRNSRPGCLRLVLRGLKSVMIGKEICLWNLAGENFMQNLYTPFYRVSARPDLSSLEEKTVLHLAENKKIQGCCPAETDQIFPWLPEEKQDRIKDAVCVLWAGQIHGSLFEDVLVALQDILPACEIIVTGNEGKINDNLSVRNFSNNSLANPPRYLWLWGDIPPLQARTMEWLGQTTVIAPAQKSWFEILPPSHHELLYPPEKPWMGLRVLERLLERAGERRKLRAEAGSYRREHYSADKIFKNKILPLLP